MTAGLNDLITGGHAGGSGEAGGAWALFARLCVNVKTGAIVVD